MQTWSSPGAPHRGGGLPSNQPGLSIRTRDLAQSLTQKRGWLEPIVKSANGFSSGVRSAAWLWRSLNQLTAALHSEHADDRSADRPTL